ncbi:hypothetical protein RHMOL_Rhmol07G0240600 [Rhododendron molle]|uniref:Uncharacterized protein n=1 Tax=Rhododendron molle TaxID=49168 RepID=A0ACC0N4C5_RHOML|nr:hypothetical protein RHMOL_Rhmol07G0240600 [Rhododendron molle]
MALIRVTTLVVVSLILVASIQLPKANADHPKDCLETCKEQCLKINSNPFSCTTTCNHLCDPNGKYYL